MDLLDEGTLYKHGGSATKGQEYFNYSTFLIKDGNVGLALSGLNFVLDKLDPNYNPGKVLKPNDVFIYVGTSVFQSAYGEEFFYRNGELLYRYDQPEGIW